MTPTLALEELWRRFNAAPYPRRPRPRYGRESHPRLRTWAFRSGVAMQHEQHIDILLAYMRELREAEGEAAKP